jgi:GAF domain-containing protein
MSNAEDLAKTYREAYDELSPSVERLQRTLMASIMAMYPNREELAVTADFLRDELGVDAIQVNVILPTKQLTIVSRPDQATEIKEIPLDSSLCVLTTSVDRPLYVDDIRNSEFLKDHPAKDDWGTWASAPVRLNAQPVGTVCALDEEAREWSTEDQMLIEASARIIETQVTDWLKSRKENRNDTTEDTA